MKKIAFVACSKTKAARPLPAAALYTSPLFRKSLLAALDSSSDVYILSAKHGVVACGEITAPYDVTLKTMAQYERREWGASVAPDLQRLLGPKSVATMFCGEEYLAPIREVISQTGAQISELLSGRSLGQRLQDLAVLNNELQLRSDLYAFNSIMRTVWKFQDGGRKIGASTGAMSWPNRGVYFILDPQRQTARSKMPRIVRVGTHAVSAGSKTSLWNRLSTHRGTIAGTGSHRSSIFRSHVGRAIMQSSEAVDWPSTWGVGQTAPRDVRLAEETLEARVSEAIADMRVVWLDIPDDAGPASDRAYIERNSIGLLSRSNLLSPLAAPDWLGSYSHDWRICVSRLWNLNHVFLRPDDAFIAGLKHYAERTIGRSLNLDLQEAQIGHRNQLNLFGRAEEPDGGEY